MPATRICGPSFPDVSDDGPGTCLTPLVARAQKIRRSIRGAGFFFFVAAGFAGSATAGSSSTAPPPDLLLVTIDTLRADAPGYAGNAGDGGNAGNAGKTPTLDRLAAAGTRYTHALTAVPLTLPSHATLLTGLDPNQTGLRDNGLDLLAASIPTLAETLRAAGYRTIAVLGSRVLDRRFGLDRGFEVYDDRMTAERTGEFGYPERSAAAVVDAALSAVSKIDNLPGASATPGRIPGNRQPLFLWVHFYDAHAPYDAPGSDPRQRYLGEVAAVDRELGRLLDALSARGRGGSSRIVAVVGDHGESFGEHGEHEHGYLLHESTLAVPLLFAGPGVASGRAVASRVAIRRVAATLVRLAGIRDSKLGGPALDLADEKTAQPVYHETEFPASTFGWSPLAAVTLGDWRFVSGPHPALFDLTADPGEMKNRLAESPDRARALKRELDRLQKRERLAPKTSASRAPQDEELRRQLESLGYLSGASAKRGTIDPRDGLRMLVDFESAKSALANGETASALATLQGLVRKSPESVPFLSQLSRAEELSGDVAAARSALLAAAAVNPENEFLQSNLGELELRAGRTVEAEKYLRRALVLQPRFTSAALALGELFMRTGRPADEEAMLRQVVAAGTDSGVLLTRLGEVELRRGDLAQADEHLAKAVDVLPEFPTAWKLWAEVARRQGNTGAAAERAARALRVAESGAER
ncbi:MAG: sulfatase-like hydrolase/transferase [Thermoanaerobaculia bacterium]